MLKDALSSDPPDARGLVRDLSLNWGRTSPNPRKCRSVDAGRVSETILGMVADLVN